MQEFRKNILNNEWVIIAAGRGKRQKDFSSDHTPRSPVPEWSETCPFCPGNEDKLAPILSEFPKGASENWRIRVVKNKYAAVAEPPGSMKNDSAFPYPCHPAIGRHEVIIESPRHDTTLGDMPTDRLAEVIDTYRSRCETLLRDPDVQSVILFRNHGPRAGTSLIHPHSQIIALHIVPEHIRKKIKNARLWYEQNRTCLYCHVLDTEQAHPRRLLYAADRFIAFVPCWASVPCEICILPRAHNADFRRIGSGEQAELARVLRASIRALRAALDDPDYNLVFHTFPREPAENPMLHWFIEITPRVTRRAGFELGSGILINPSGPEEDADLLRGHLHAEPQQT